MNGYISLDEFYNNFSFLYIGGLECGVPATVDIAIKSDTIIKNHRLVKMQQYYPMILSAMSLS